MNNNKGLIKFIVKNILNDINQTTEGCHLLKQMGETQLANKLIYLTRSISDGNKDHELYFEIKNELELLTYEEHRQWHELIELKSRLKQMPCHVNVICFPDFGAYEFLDNRVKMIKFKKHINRNNFKDDVDITFHHLKQPSEISHSCEKTRESKDLPSSTVLRFMNHMIKTQMHVESHE